MGFTAVAAAAIGGFVVSSQVNKPKSVQQQGATPPPQATKTPDAAAVAAGQAGSGQAGGSPGVASTFLTGPGGIDPALLNLGKQTLLGQ